MPDPRWMSVVFYQRQQSAALGRDERPPYGDVDAEPLPAEPERERASVSSRLAIWLRSVIRTSHRTSGALR